MTCDFHHAQIAKWAEHTWGPITGWLNRGNPQLSVDAYNQRANDRRALVLSQIKGIRDDCAKGSKCSDD